MDSLFELINYPIAMILKLCYMVIGNYGWAIIVFAIIAKAALFPLAVKTEKTRLKQQKLQPKIAELQYKYKGKTRDPKYAEEMQALYQKEGVSQTAGCLPTLIQFPLVIGLWNAIRRPLYYICNLKVSEILTIATTLFNNGVESIVKAVGGDISKLTTAWIKTNEITVARAMQAPENFGFISDILPENFKALNLDFFGLDLAAKPSDYGILSWFILMPIIAGVTSFLTGWISQKVNAPKDGKQQKVPGMNALLYTMPIMSIIFAYSFNVGVGIYWIVSNLLSIAQIFILRLVVKPEPEKVAVKKEKKLNYNQIEKMKREAANAPSEVIVVDENVETDKDIND